MVESKEEKKEEVIRPKKNYKHIAVRPDTFKLFRKMRAKYSRYNGRHGGDNAFLKQVMDEFEEVPDV